MRHAVPTALRAASFFVLAALAMAAGCTTRTVDLGANEAGGSAPLGGQVVNGSQYGCDEWNDEEMSALRGGVCAASCSATGEDMYALGSKRAVMAATAGQWLFCSADLFGPPGVVGVEFAPGCRVFFLRHDSEGNLVRGVEQRWQASYDIDPVPGATIGRIDLHLDHTTTMGLEVTAYRCPERLHLSAASGQFALARDLHGRGDVDPTK
jgi:hypothetical protein